MLYKNRVYEVHSGETQAKFDKWMDNKDNFDKEEVKIIEIK